MGKSILIADTTRDERMAIVVKALDVCGNNACKPCVGCQLGGSLERIYQPYIDGEMEIAEINRARAARSYVHGV